MCGRYANHLDRLQGWEDIFVDWPEDVPVGFNVSPTQVVPVFTGAGGAGMRWGLIPNWSREASGKYSTFNARIESVESKPAFRHAWSVSQHCLIPAVGYYEWRAEQGAKQPYFVRPADS